MIVGSFCEACLGITDLKAGGGGGGGGGGGLELNDAEAPLFDDWAALKTVKRGEVNERWLLAVPFSTNTNQ